jgi:hypothetical protein
MVLAETAPDEPDPDFRPRPRPSRANTLVLRLFPGPAYSFTGGGTLLRGRVQTGLADDPQPARWARLVARKGTALLGAAQADERGEYALLLRYPPGLLAPATPSPNDGRINLTVAARSDPGAHESPFDDLASEPAAVVAVDANPLANLPAGYDLRTTVQRTVVFGRVHSGPDLDFLLPPEGA